MAKTKKSKKTSKVKARTSVSTQVFRVLLIFGIFFVILSSSRYEMFYSDSFSYKIQPVEKEKAGWNKLFTNLDKEIEQIVNRKKDELSARFAFIVWLNERKKLKHCYSEAEWQKIFDKILKTQKLNG